MPKVVKQTLKPVTRRPVTDLRSRGREIGVGFPGFKMNIYGRGKTGKTRLACSFPKKLMLIGAAGYGTEDGTRSLGKIDGKFFPLNNTEEVEELAAIAVEDDYQTVVLDTAGGLQERVVNEFLGRDGSARKDWSTVPKGDWGAINGMTIKRLRALLDLADQQQKYVVIIAHERNFNDESNNSDLIFPTVGAALTPGVAGWLDGACDYIAQTFIREQSVLGQKIKVTGREVQTKNKTGKAEFCLRIGPHPVYKTGFRLAPSSNLPDLIIDPSFEKIMAIINQ